MKFVLTSLMAVIATVAMQGSANAAFSVTLSVQGFPTQVITDGGAGDLDGAANFILAQGTIDGYTFRVTANTNSPSGGFGGQFVVQQNALITADGATAGPLTILAASTDFNTGTASPITLQVFNALAESNFDRGTATAITTINPPGGLAGSTPVATVLGGTIPSSEQTTMSATVSMNPFTISNTLTITGLTRFAGEGGSPQFNGTLTSTALQDTQPTPVPPAIVLAITGIPLFGLFRRRWINS